MQTPGSNLTTRASTPATVSPDPLMQTPDSNKETPHQETPSPILVTPNDAGPLENFVTPSPYAILPTPEQVVGADNSLTKDLNSSIGTEATIEPWSPRRSPGTVSPSP